MTERPVTETSGGGVAWRPVGPAEARRAARSWWDAQADRYQAEHADVLGVDRLVWGPEGLDEADVCLLGDVAGRRSIEVGCGAAQGSRWLLAQGADPVALDLSGEQLRHARALDAARRPPVPLVQADACRLPFADEAFDIAFAAYGALQFVADSGQVMAEVARVLRPGGRWVGSFTHPIRWCFPDDPGTAGLVASTPYWHRVAYVEEDDRGRATYVESHATIGDRVREVVGTGLVLVDLVEPEWPAEHDRTWGAWSPLRGAVLPGTAIVVADKPAG